MQLNQSTSFLKILLKLIQRYDDPNEIAQLLIQDQLTMFILYQEPYYLSDGQFSIQARFLQYDKIITNPYNKVRGKYYNTFKQAARTLNCPNHMLSEPIQKHLTPYTPYYHFRQRMEQFKRDREKIWNLKLTKIIVKQWLLSTVNIANTGYYAPLITVVKFQKVGDFSIKDIKPISVLYIPELIDYYLKYRASQVRKYHKNQSINEQSQLCYFIKDKKGKQNFNLQMVNVDIQCKLLNGNKKFDNPRQLKYLFFGNPNENNSGTFCFKKPFQPFNKNLNTPFLTQRMNEQTKMNQQFIQSAFRSRWQPRIQQNIQSSSQDTDQLLNSSQQLRRGACSQMQDQQSSDQDPLKIFYTKLLQQGKQQQE